jgi:hypothetical protein
VITLLIFGEAYMLWSSSLCSLLQFPSTSSWVQIFSSASCSQALAIYILPLLVMHYTGDCISVTPVQRTSAFCSLIWAGW